MELIGVAAVAENGVIGDGDELPWPSVPADRRQYRERVADHPVILGRRTFELMRDDPAGRWRIVLSRQSRSYDDPHAVAVSSVEEAIDAAASFDAEVAYVIGGEAIYELFLPHLDRIFLSRIPGSYEGDSTFPDLDDERWILADTTEATGFTLERWERR